MCRSIKVLRTSVPASEEEIDAAALQFVRKVSGFRQPTEKNREAFDAAVQQVAESTRALLAALPPGKGNPNPTPRPRVYRTEATTAVPEEAVLAATENR